MPVQYGLTDRRPDAPHPIGNRMNFGSIVGRGPSFGMRGASCRACWSRGSSTRSSGGRHSWTFRSRRSESRG